MAMDTVLGFRANVLQKVISFIQNEISIYHRTLLIKKGEIVHHKMCLTLSERIIGYPNFAPAKIGVRFVGCSCTHYILVHIVLLLSLIAR